MISSNPLPPLYARWIGELLSEPLPEEKRSDCLNCPMIREREPRCDADRQFHPRTKCCTFLPDIPNYLVGMILRDDSPEFRTGREAFERGALKRLNVGPLGVYKSRERAFIQALSAGSFGQDLEQLCPFYLAESGGLCGIWKYRNSRCSTWFCLYDRGTYGVGLWEEIYALLKHLERSLAQWNLKLIRFSLQSYWGDWQGREREFFEECARRVEELSWPEILALAGPEALQLADNVSNTFRIFRRPVLPERLRRASWRVQSINPNRARVWAYSPFDSMDLDQEVLDALELFDGQPVDDALVQIRREKGLRLDPALLRKLVDLWILVPDV